MSYKEAEVTVSLVANADLSAKQYHLVKLANASGVAQVAICGDGEDAAGVLQDNPTSGKVGAVAVAGITQVKCGAALTAGARFASDANGKAVPVATGDTSLGFVLESATADGDIVPALIGKL